jgi:hypothetical protein
LATFYRCQFSADFTTIMSGSEFSVRTSVHAQASGRGLQRCSEPPAIRVAIGDLIPKMPFDGKRFIFGISSREDASERTKVQLQSGLIY